MTASSTVIGRLRIRSPAGLRNDPEAATARRLSAIDVRPSGLPPSAILCIRRLEDPAPGTLQVDEVAGTPTAAWAAAFTRSIEGAARGASRPADGPVPPSANAVIFRDRVELLACLAEDWAALGGRNRWWWRSLAGHGDRVVERAWLREPHLVPAVVDLLERRHSLGHAVAALDPDLSLRIAVAVLDGAGFHDAAGALDVVGLPNVMATSPRSAAPAAPPDRNVLGDRDPSSHEPGAAPGRSISTAGLSGANATLAFVALAVHRDPRLLHAQGVAEHVPAQDATRTDAHPTAISPLEPGPASARPGSSDSDPPREHAARHPLTAAAPSAAPPDIVDSHAPPGAPSTLGHNDPPRLVHTHRRADRRADSPPVSAKPAPIASTVTNEPEPAVREDATRTELGGLFYLLPLAIYLDLYADFTRPRVDPAGLDPWDFVTLLGLELGASAGAEGDPIWPLLAGLANRTPTEAPGALWRPPRSWTIDPKWLADMPNGNPWTWSSPGRRLRVEHPEGFAIVDATSRARTERGVRTALRRAIPALTEVPALVHASAPRRARRSARDRWIAEVAAYVRPRLRLALSLATGADLSQVLFRYPASVFVDDESVTVELSLEALPIEIRIAGLDRDLGWVPAARRALWFRFV